MMNISTPKRSDATVAGSGSSTKTAKQIAADENKAARLLAKETEQKESDNRFTPPQLVRATEYSFGTIDFDPCWHPASAVAPRAYLDVRQGHNGLRDEWSGHVALVNPPWSAQAKWLKRAFDQWLKGNVATIVCLVPAKTDAKFFHDILFKYARVYFLEGRPHFFKEDGSSEPTMVSTMVVIFGADDEQAARFAKVVRGSWWRSERPSGAVAPKESFASSSLLVENRTLMSCAAQDHHVRRTVLCRPFANPCGSAGC